MNIKNIKYLEGIIIQNQQSVEDKEWANDWKTIVDIFNLIDKLKQKLQRLDVSYLRELQQEILILNIEKYAWSLQNYIIEKYSKQ
ncbi:MAG: hypothetical protein ACQERB_10085 [Promethearchaeati archaeon]|nr:MAG: hypothetical protein EU543_02905 [Candidatus Lokiarchaeota archaeon]